MIAGAGMRLDGWVGGYIGGLVWKPDGYGLGS